MIVMSKGLVTSTIRLRYGDESLVIFVHRDRTALAQSLHNML